MDKYTVSMHLLGEDYPLLLSMRAVYEISKRWGGVETAFLEIEKMPEHEQVEAVVWLASILLEEGANYSELETGEEIRRFTENELFTLLNINDLQPIFNKLVETVIAGQQTEISVEPPEGAKKKKKWGRK